MKEGRKKTKEEGRRKRKKEKKSSERLKEIGGAREL